MHLEGGKEPRDDESPQIFAAIGQHNTGNHRRQIGQCPHLPDVTGRNDNQEIGAEGPQDGTQRSQMLAEVEGTQQDIEAQQVDKHIPHVLRQSQVVDLLQRIERGGRLIRRSQLIGGHAREERVGPTGHLACALFVGQLFLSGTYASRRVVAVENTSLNVGREEIGERQNGKKEHCQHIGQYFFESVHVLFCLIWAQRYEI